MGKTSGDKHARDRLIKSTHIHERAQVRGDKATHMKGDKRKQAFQGPTRGHPHEGGQENANT